jgi:hypothetical protein
MSIDRPLGRIRHHFDIDVIGVRLEFLKEARQPAIAAIGAAADPHDMARFYALPGDVVLDPLQLRQDASGLVVQAFGGRRHLHLLVALDEQIEAQPPLGLADLMAQRRLGQPQHCRRLGHAASPRHCLQHPQMANFKPGLKHDASSHEAVS